MSDRELFIAALDHPDPADRQAFLDAACAGDADRRRRVEVLLHAYEEASQFLAVPPAERLPDPTPDDQTRAGDTSPTAEADISGLLDPPDKPGQLGKLGHYEILGVVGRGGMGVVLKAFDPKLHRLAAVKLMAAQLAASATARRRFEREARAVAAVRHEHVVAIHVVEPDGPTPYLVMEFVNGVSLQDRLEQRGPLGVKDVLRIGTQTALGLAAAHAKGLVHRDVKPANILLENEVERVKITDFGLARADDDANLTQSGVIAGTPNYMSPEQAAGATVDARSDLFSFGSVLYALCTGHPPFRADTPLAVIRRVCDDTPRPVREVNPHVPDWLEAIVGKLLAKDPADRFQTATEVADLLGRHLAHLQQPDSVPMPELVHVPVRDPVPPAEPGWKPIFSAADRRRWWAQRGLFAIGTLIVVWSIIGLILVPVTKAGRGVLSGVVWDVVANVPQPYTTFPVLIVLGVGLSAAGAYFVRQRWDIPYKGRTLRFENSLLTAETLSVDGVAIARGIFLIGRPRELFGTIRDGPGAGDVIHARVTHYIGQFRCDISAREGGPAIGPLSVVPPEPTATPGRVLDGRTALALGIGYFVLTVGLVSSAFVSDLTTPDERKVRTLVVLVSTWGTVALLAFGPGVFVARRWWRKRLPSDRRADARAAVLAGLGVGFAVMSIVLIVVRTPALRAAVFGDPVPHRLR